MNRRIPKAKNSPTWIPSFAGMTVIMIFAATLALTACGLEKPGTPLEHYRPVVVPKTFDAVMAARRDDGVLRAGVKVVDVTPRDRNCWMAGFNQMRKSEGILDPINARIVFLDDGREAVVLIALDFVGLLNYDVNRLRALITEKHQRRIQIASTHNHEGPDPMGYWGPGLLVPYQSGVDQEWLDKSLQEIAIGVNEAIASAQPVRLAIGETLVEKYLSDNIWFAPGEGPNDRRMSVIRLEKLDGAPLATIVNWACHAETLLNNHLLSADFPGRVCGYVAKKGGGTGVFFNGALGGMISAYICRFDHAKEYDELPNRIAWMDRTGEKLAEYAMNAVAGAPRDEHPRIHLRSGDVFLPVKNKLLLLLAKRGIFPVPPEQRGSATFHSEVGLLKIGGAWIAMTPGEPFPKLGMMLKDAMPYAKVPFVFGLTDDELAYMMLPDQWDDEHYSYERSMSLGPQTAKLVYDGFVGLLAQEN